ncbi:ABC transporter substrate-binding protein [uncultured Lamprocystis sp.]|uniref:ABC transporter substrate-binding protein n=3 Tax=uncultured Lamprocystis sp. TaxID=543132 RepID=UPI0025D9CCF0|nr:ABC transporter substrate-binding protein [uncultured Lamprocystis sp.]
MNAFSSSTVRRQPLSTWFILVAAVVGVCWWVTGWAEPPAGETGGSAGVEGAPLTPISVQLQWRHQWQFAGFYAALEQGYYRDAGLAVELREYAEGIDIIDAVVAGRADFGTYYSTVIAERMSGRPIRLLASYLKRSPLVLLVRPGLYSPADLKGLRVMANAQELGSANIRQMLKLGGLTESDLQVVPHSFSVEPFVRGEVDAMTAFTTNEPFYLHQRGVPFNVVDPSDYGIALYDLNLFTAADYAAAHPARVRAFVAATNRGWEYALAHPDDLVDLILARYNTQGKERDHLRFEAHQTHSAILPEVYPIGSIDPIQLNRIQDLFVATGLAAQTLPSADLVFVPEAAGAPPPPDAPLVLNDAERTAIAAQPRLRVRFAEIAPYALMRDGRPTGYTVELLARMAQLAGLELDWQEQSLEQIYRNLREGRADLTINSLVTTEREGFLNFSARRYPVPFTIFARTDCTDCADFDALRGRTLATPVGSELMRRLVGSHPEIQQFPVAGYREALEAVAAGHADAAILERQNGRYLLAEHLIGGVEAKGSADLGDGATSIQAALFAMRRDLEPLARVLDKARNTLGPGELQAIWDRWFHDPATTAVPPPTQLATLTLPEREFLAAHSKLRVVYTDAPPAAIPAIPWN